MNKKEAIEKIKNIETLNIKDRIADKGVDMVIKNQVLDIVSQIDEPQKVAIPKFVAEWIEEAKAGGYLLYTAFDLVDGNDRTFNWLFDGHESNQDTFARAWLDGYDVEKEKLYTVEIPNPDSDSLTVLEKLDDGTVVISQMDVFPVDWRVHAEYQITEQEIRKNFEWAWQWAKEVE